MKGHSDSICFFSLLAKAPNTCSFADSLENLDVPSPSSVSVYAQPSHLLTCCFRDTSPAAGLCCANLIEGLVSNVDMTNDIIF